MKKLLFTLIALLCVHGAVAQTPPCNIQFTVAPVQGTTQTVNLVNNSTFTTVPGATPVMWIQWGDNNTQSISYMAGQGYNHTYANAGNYIITVGAMHYDSINSVMICSSTDTHLVVISTLSCATSITKTNNGSGAYTFTANNIGGGSGITYTWNFGDGSPTVTGSPVNHTYANSGNYTVTVTATSATCQTSATTSVQIFTGTLNCSQYLANFSAFGTGYTRTFNNTSTGTNNIPGASIKRVANWDFGDATTLTTNSLTTNHTYAAAGTYTVILVNNWVDSFSNVVYCTATTSQTITITTPPPPPNVISGYVYWDSMNTTPVVSQSSFKVWLITHDPLANTLTAIDSQIVSGYFAAPYSFSGYPAGSYRTKAAALSGTAAAGVLLPTYHDSSLYWNTALVINHAGASSTNRNIKMKQGVNAGGPGFIGGNISQGANKGTGAGVPNVLVAILNSLTNQVVRFGFTDGNGDYSFGNLPLGSYIVFPESMNYITTPSPVLSIVSGQTFATGINFKHTTTHILPIAASLNAMPDDDLFSIYPNPSKGHIQINWTSGMKGQANVSVLDMTGREVMTLAETVSKPTRINMALLPAGVYFIKVTTDRAQHTEKIVLQH